MRAWLFLTALLVMLASGGCATVEDEVGSSDGDSDSDSDSDSDTDTDSDTDVDTDTDTDADTDTDTDVDTDTDTDTGTGTDTDTGTGTDTDTGTGTDTDTADCPMNSGWPCMCQVVNCDNGDDCIQITTLGDGTTGFCTPVCDCASSFGCPSTPYDAQSSCALTNSLEPPDEECHCAMINCEGDDLQCPPGQTCQMLSTTWFCHPPA